MGRSGSRPLLRVRSPWFVLGLVVGSFLLHVRTLRSYFLGDDFEVIAAVVRTGPTVGWLNSLGPGSQLRPVLYADLWLGHRLFGTDPLGWHVENLLLHALCAWLAALLADDLLRPRVAGPVGDGDRLRSTVGPLAGVLFLVSPVHVEAVSWIVARVDPLRTILCLTSLLAWIRWRRGRRWMLALCLVALALALYTKESVLPFGAVILAFELWLPDRSVGRRASLRAALPGLAGVGVVTAAYLAHYLSLDAGYLTEEGQVLSSQSPVLIARRGVQVAMRTVLPAFGRDRWWAIGVLAVVALVALVVLAVARQGFRDALAPHLARFGFLATALVVMVAPVARLGVSPFTSAGDRLAYLPSVFSTIAVALALGLLVVHAPRVGRVVVVGVVVVAALALVLADGAYVRAGRLSESVVASQADWPRDEEQVAVLVPDTLEGAWVGRNAFGASLELIHGWTYRPAYVELGPIRMADVDDEVRVRRGDCPRCVTFELADPDAELVGPPLDALPYAVSGTDVTVLRRTDTTMDVEIGPEVDPATVWYVSDGRFQSLAGIFD